MIWFIFPVCLDFWAHLTHDGSVCPSVCDWTEIHGIIHITKSIAPIPTSYTLGHDHSPGVQVGSLPTSSCFFSLQLYRKWNCWKWTWFGLVSHLHFPDTIIRDLLPWPMDLDLTFCVTQLRKSTSILPAKRGQSHEKWLILVFLTISFYGHVWSWVWWSH